MSGDKHTRSIDETAHRANAMTSSAYVTRGAFFGLLDAILMLTWAAAAFALVAYIFRETWLPWQYALFTTASTISLARFVTSLCIELRRERKIADRLGKRLLSIGCRETKKLRWFWRMWDQASNYFYMVVLPGLFVPTSNRLEFNADNLFYLLFVVLSISMAHEIGKRFAQDRTAVADCEFHERGVRTLQHRSGYDWDDIIKTHWWHDAPRMLEIVVPSRKGEPRAFTLPIDHMEIAQAADLILSMQLKSRHTPFKLR